VLIPDYTDNSYYSIAAFHGADGGYALSDSSVGGGAPANILREGIVSAIGLQDTPHIVGVGGDSLRVGVVGAHLLTHLNTTLLPNKTILADTGSVAHIGQLFWNGDSLRVGVVGVGVLHGTAEHLVPEELADVGDATGGVYLPR
jgi:hypothetical protein